MSILALVALIILSLIVVLIFVPLIIGTTLGFLARISHCIHNDTSQKSEHEIFWEDWRKKEREDFIMEELRGFRVHELIKPRPREDDINSVFIRTMANIKLNAEEFETFLKDEEKERFQAVKHTMECIAEFANDEELAFLVEREKEERRSHG